MSQQQQQSPTRYDPTASVSLPELVVGDRIARAVVPPAHGVDADEPRSKHYHTDSDEPFIGRIVARNTRHNDIRHCLVVDEDAGMFARLSAHAKSQAWTQTEEDWKVRDLGSVVEVVDVWDTEIADADEPDEFVADWGEILFSNVRHGEDPGDEIDHFEGDTFRLRDHDGRRAAVKYELVDEEETQQ